MVINSRPSVKFNLDHELPLSSREGAFWQHFQNRDEKMVAGTLFWPAAFSRKRAKIEPITIFPSPRKNEKEIFCWPPFLSSPLIFIIQANGYGPSYHGLGNALGLFSDLTWQYWGGYNRINE